MNINFNKTDRLIQIIEEAADSINFFEKWMQHLTRIKELSNTGYYITTDKKKVDVNIPDSEIIDKKRRLIRTIKKSYWQVGAKIRFTCPDAELEKNLEQNFKDECDKDIILEVVTAHEPTVKDIEKEFMSNLTDYLPNSISSLVNVYREYWKGHLAKCDDALSISHAPFDSENDLYPVFHKAIELNLFTEKEAFSIALELEWIAFKLNSITDDILGMLEKWQSSTQSKTDINLIEDKTSSTASNYTIENKTDFIKIISAMYDCRMFKTIDGRIASNKKELIKALGEFFNIEINDYSKLLSAAKNTNNYLEIFDKLKQKGEDYYNKQ